MNKHSTLGVLASMAALAAASCGGGGGSAGTSTPAPDPNAARQAAAAATARNNAACQAIGPFYWEIGDAGGALGSDSVGTQPDGTPYKSSDELNIASASKWLFAAYVVEKLGDVPAYVPYLNFTSGYSNFDNALCSPMQTIAECNNGGIDAVEAAAQTFHYEGGHMQELAAAKLGLGNLHVGELATEVQSMLGNIGLSYVEPQPPGGARISAAGYASFLRRLLAGSTQPLKLGALLASHAVCTQPDVGNCNASTETAGRLPENFHYGLGHWIEDDATNTPASNFAYSSAGAFGFYPWVDFDRTLYGIVAQQNSSGETSGTGEGYASLQCGRLIRLAWKTGTAQ